MLKPKVDYTNKDRKFEGGADYVDLALVSYYKTTPRYLPTPLSRTNYVWIFPTFLCRISVMCSSDITHSTPLHTFSSPRRKRVVFSLTILKKFHLVPREREGRSRTLISQMNGNGFFSFKKELERKTPLWLQQPLRKIMTVMVMTASNVDVVFPPTALWVLILQLSWLESH